MKMSDYTISKLAGYIRDCDDDFASLHDDYECVQRWSMKSSFWVNPNKVDIPKEICLHEKLRDFIEEKFAARAKLLDVHTKKANKLYSEFKELIGRLLNEDEALLACKDLASSDTTSLIQMVTDIDAVRAAANIYYKTQSEDSREGPANMRKLGETIFITFKDLHEGNEIESGRFTGDNEVLDEPICKLSKIMKTVNPSTREQLKGILSELMHEMFSCFVLYRMPVNVMEGQPPIPFSRFLPAVSFRPFLQLYGVDMTKLTM